MLLKTWIEGIKPIRSSSNPATLQNLKKELYELVRTVERIVGTGIVQFIANLSYRYETLFLAGKEEVYRRTLQRRRNLS